MPHQPFQIQQILLRANNQKLQSSTISLNNFEYTRCTWGTQPTSLASLKVTLLIQWRFAAPLVGRNQELQLMRHYMLTTELKYLEKIFSGNKGNCAKHMKLKSHLHLGMTLLSYRTLTYTSHKQGSINHFHLSYSIKL